MTLLSFASPFAKTGSGYETGFWIFLSFFLAVSVLHLAFCFFDEFWRKLTKPFCMVLLGAAMAFLVPDYPLVYVSCWISAVGDLLLIKQNVPKYFLSGVAVFAVAHTLNAVNQTFLLSYSFPDYGWVIFACAVLIAAVIGYFTHGESNTLSGTVGPAFSCFHLGNIVLASMVLADGKHIVGGVLVLVGYLIYGASDFLVGYYRERKLKHRNFYVMLTYLAAQALIYFGLAFALLG